MKNIRWKFHKSHYPGIPGYFFGWLVKVQPNCIMIMCWPGLMCSEICRPCFLFYDRPGKILILAQKIITIVLRLWFYFFLSSPLHKKCYWSIISRIVSQHLYRDTYRIVRYCIVAPLLEGADFKSFSGIFFFQCLLIYQKFL